MRRSQGVLSSRVSSHDMSRTLHGGAAGGSRAPISFLLLLLGGAAGATWLVVWARDSETGRAPVSSSAPLHHAWVATAERSQGSATPFAAPAVHGVEPRAAVATIHGRVVDARGEPVGGAQLALLFLWELYERGVLDDALLDVDALPANELAADAADVDALSVTAADGTFSLPLREAFLGVIVASAPGTVFALSDVIVADEGTDTTVEIVLRPAGVASGVVTNENGEPVPAMSVSLSTDRAWVEATTDDGGRFSLAALPPARWMLSTGGGAYMSPDPLPIVLGRETRVVVETSKSLAVTLRPTPVDIGPFEVVLFDGRAPILRVGSDYQTERTIVAFQGLRAGSYEAWLVADGFIADLGGATITHRDGTVGFEAALPTRTEPIDTPFGRSLRAALDGDDVERLALLCLPDVDTVPLHGRAVVTAWRATDSIELEPGDALVAVEGEHVRDGDVEGLSVSAVPCATRQADFSVLVEKRRTGRRERASLGTRDW